MQIIRNIVLILLFLGFIGGLGYSYLYFKQKKQPISEAINAIPTSAALIIESKNTFANWKNISSTNLIWQELITTDFFGELESQLINLDSLMNKHDQINQLLKKQSIYLSAHMSGANAFNFLFTTSIPSTQSKDQINSFLKNELNAKDHKNYDNIAILKFSDANPPFYCIHHNGIISFSSSLLLIEDVIRQLNSSSTLLSGNDFSKVMNTAGKNIDLNFYVNYKTLPNVLSTYINPNFHENLDQLSDFGSWSEVDLYLKPNSINLNGFTYSNDTINNYLNVYNGQSPQKIEVFEIAPENTAYLMHLGFSDFKLFQKNYARYLEKNNRLFEFGAKLKLLETKYNVSIQQSIYDWLDNEIAIFITQTSDPEIKDNSYAVLKTYDAEIALHQLDELSRISHTVNEVPFDSVEYKGFTIKSIAIRGLLGTTLNPTFKLIQNNFYTLINDYVVFANSETALRSLINQYTLNKTLENNITFNQFKENIIDKSTLFVYVNPSKSIELTKRFSSENFANALNNHEELMRKFEGAIVQITSDQSNLFYNNLYVKYNPIQKKETSSLWEFQLDTTVSQNPIIVLNHYTGLKEILIQDDANKIYLISNTGKLLWKRSLGEKIMGTVEQIDAYKNNKLQLVFNTSSKLYLIDRNGKDVDDFPIKIRQNASAPASVIDYDKNKNYRILVPTTNGEILNFDQSGKQVKGWEFKKSKSPIISKIDYLTVNRKDYLVGITASGKIYVLNRKGEERLKLEQKLVISSASPIYLETKKQIGKSFILTQDTLGKITKVFFGDSTQQVTLPTEIKQPFYFSYFDVNQDKSKDYIVTSQNELKAFNQDGELICEYEFEEPISSSPFQVVTNNSIAEIGVTLINHNKIYLLTDAATLHQGFPLFGSSSFKVNDINNDQILELVVASKDGYIYTYTLQ